jgi:hypothetical protein
MIVYRAVTTTHHRAVREPSRAQRSSRWLNLGAMALLFAGASFVRPDIDTSLVASALLRSVTQFPSNVGHHACAFTLGARCSSRARSLSRARREHPGC